MSGESTLRIAAHVGVKDEVELIARCIAHLRDIGVSEFFVCDMNSTDGTGAILDSLRSASFHIVSASNMDSDEDWFGVNEAAIRNCHADWLVFVDADEFILPASGSLPCQLAGADVDLFFVPRYNVPLGPSGPILPASLRPEHYSEIDLIVESMPEFRQQLNVDTTLPWIRHVPVPKVIVRPHLIGRLGYGMHDVIPLPGKELRATIAVDIVTAHLPFTTEARFIRKIENIREFLTYHGEADPEQAWHWRRWLELADRGEISSEFRCTSFSHDTLANLRWRGVVRTVAEVLARVA